MKKLWLTPAAVLALGLAACGSASDQPTTDQPVEDQPAESQTESTTGSQTEQPAANTATDQDSDQMKSDMDQLSFKEIEVEVSYGHDQEYEVEIEQDENEPIKAKVEDELNQNYLKGQEAFDDLYPRVKQLDLTKDSTKEETISQVLNAFELQDNYEKFEVEITFNDGSKLDIEDRK